MPKYKKITGDDGRDYYFTSKSNKLKKVIQNGKVFWDEKSKTIGYIPNNVFAKLNS